MASVAEHAGPIRVYDLSGEDITNRTIKVIITAHKAVATVLVRDSVLGVVQDANGKQATYEIALSRVAGDSSFA